MTESEDRSLKMLSTALEMEKKGYDFYEKALKKTSNKLGRELFTTLRDDEVVHMERIQNIYESVKGGGWSEEWKKMKARGKSLGPFFKELAAGEESKIKGDASDIEALEVGISFEAKAVEYYQDHLNRATDPIEREFIEQMMIEEKGHYDLLVDMKYYLTDPDNWFAEQEKISIDGA